MSHDEDMDFFPPRFTITSTLMERAIGEVKSTTTVFFDNIEGVPKHNKSPRDSTVIRKVIQNLQSGSYNITKTYFFNEKGELVYHNYLESGYECYERSYYFNDSCIYFTQAPHSFNDCESDDIKETITKTKFSRSEKKDFLQLKQDKSIFDKLLWNYIRIIR